MKYIKIIKSILQKYLFIFHLKNFNFSNVTVLCYNVTPVLLFKCFGIKSKIFSNHGIAMELYNGAKEHSKGNVLFINEDCFFIKFFPKKWKYIYHFNLNTYKYIYQKKNFSLITAGNTYKYNNNAIYRKLAQSSKYNIDSFRLMKVEEHECCLMAESILSIGTNGVFKEFQNDYPNKSIFQLNNSTYFKNRINNPLFERTEVLMIAGRGSFHKGVDVYFKLAEINPEIIFNLIHPYDLNEIEIPLNVVIHGFILPTNPLFSEICLRSRVSCFFSISEGFPGSLCDSLAFGLLPIVPKDLGLEFSDCFEFNDFEELQSKFSELYYNFQYFEKRQSSIELWKSKNITIDVFRSQVKEYFTSLYN